MSDIKVNLYPTVPPTLGLASQDNAVSDGVLYSLWHNWKMDTYDIARRVGLPESVVYSRLPKIRNAIRPRA